MGIVRDDFGDTAERIARALLRGEGLRIAELVNRLESQPPSTSTCALSVHEIKCSLLKLLQHNLLDIKPASISADDRRRDGASNPAVYHVNVREALYRLRFPKFIEMAREEFGEEGEVIMEELLVQGRVRMDQSIESMAYSLAEYQRQTDESKLDEEITEAELEENRGKIRAAFVEMAKRRYISRVHPLDLTTPAEKEQPDFPPSIARGLESSSSTNANIKKEKAADGNTQGNTRTSSGSTNASSDAADGITIRGKRKKQNGSTAENIPVELQMMLEADEAARKKEDEEAEFEGMEPRPKTSKKRKLSKKAKLPSKGASASESKDDTDAVGGMPEQALVWRYGADQLMRDLRHRACVKFATENINSVAGVVVAAMLKHSSPHEREKDEATSFPVSARDLFSMPEVKNALPKDSKDTWRLLLNYITVMCRDKSGMVMKVAAESFDPTQARASDGGQYVVHMKKIVDFLKQATSHSYIQLRFGTQSARIVRLLIEKRQLEQKTVGELALLPSNDARRRLYELYGEKLIKMQEIPKRSDHNPAFTIFCWSVDVQQMERTIVERIQDSICKMRHRRKHEAEENKELIARSDQLVEPNDLAKFDKLSRSLDRLDRAIIQLDDMLMLYRDF